MWMRDSSLRWSVLLDYIFGVAVLIHYGLDAQAFFDKQRLPFSNGVAAPTAPPKKPPDEQARKFTAAKRNRASNDGGQGSSRRSRSRNHGMSLERAEKLMALISACSPAGRAYAKAQREKEAAARASIESWVCQTHSASDVSTSLSSHPGWSLIY
jgi:hypothetical protein